MGPVQGHNGRGEEGRETRGGQTQQRCLGGGNGSRPQASGYRGGIPPPTMGQWLLWLAPVSGAHLVLLSTRWSEKSAALPVLSSNSAPMLTYCVTLMGCRP